MKIKNIDRFKQGFNIGPSRFVPAFRKTSKKITILEPMKWGTLQKSWGGGGSGSNFVINARFEEVKQKPMFSKVVETNRCVVCLDGYYEWKQNVQGSMNKSGTVPNFIHFKDS
jgi:putative SOS response-associated peptidase YedK